MPEIVFKSEAKKNRVSILDHEFDPPFEIIEPSELTSPVVLNSPHSGRVYPSRFLASSRLDPMTLRRSEDAFVDGLFRGCVRFGMPMMHAHFPRAFLDLNREPYELDPRMFDGRLPAFANTRSLRVAGGLGTIPRVVGEAHEIYARRLPVDEVSHRIEKLYKPYHRSLRRLLARAVDGFGVSVLIDCHSMPSSAYHNVAKDERTKSDFVLGDRYGTSCAQNLVDVAEYELRRLGYSVQRNKPYAGGFITESYGNPSAGCHALQIEVNRALYMDERAIEPGPRFERLAQDLAIVVEETSAAAKAGLSKDRLAAE
jgi:N-formylglutamate amidohydrolase